MAIDRSATSRLPPRAGVINRPAPAPLTASAGLDLATEPVTETVVEDGHAAVEANLQLDYTGDLNNSDEVAAAAAATGVAVEALGGHKKKGRPVGTKRPKAPVSGLITIDNPKARLKEITDEVADIRRVYLVEAEQLRQKYQPRLDALKAEHSALMLSSFAL